jgi:large subunit ribosomal protein L4
VVLDSMEMEKPKTKVMADMLKSLPLKNASRLVVSLNDDKKTYLASRNIAKTGVSEARNLNVADVLNYKYVLVSKDGIKDIEKTFVK